MSRVLKFPSKLRQLWSLQLLGPHSGGQYCADRLFFLSHEHYLSRHLTLAQRIDCAIAHYGFERQNYNPDYHRAIYHSSRGLRLWYRTIGGRQYSIDLRATEDNRHEGDLSILCCVNDVRICRLSFSYVDRSIFGQASQRTLFVTRNQTDNSPERKEFSDAFKQNSPQYFCIAAACGVAMANGMRSMLMIKAGAQIAYADRYAESFRHSYSELWQKLGAQDIGDRHAYLMPVPMPLNPLTIVKHKTRALARRHNWQEITQSARQTMLEHRISRLPVPTGEEETSWQETVTPPVSARRPLQV